jgi:sprouty-related EVH1 domain-containing protein
MFYCNTEFGIELTFQFTLAVRLLQELDLPISRTGSSSQSTTSTTTSSPQSPTSYVPSVPDTVYNNNTQNTSHLQYLHRVHYLQPQNSRNKYVLPSPSDKGSDSNDSLESHDVWLRKDEPTSISGKSDQGLLDSDNVEFKEYSYVIFARNPPHEYSYPNLEPTYKPPSKREAIISSRKPSQITVQPKPPLPMKTKKKDKHKNLQTGRLLTKARCKHCHEMFSRQDNHRGSCEEAPDNVEKCIEIVTCVWCAKGLIYHCMSDADGEYGHPCICDSSDESNCKKWTVLSVLSLFVPCLWCYWPLKACHMCGVSCGCCGGRHKAS